MKITIDKIINLIPKNNESAKIEDLMLACNYNDIKIFKKDLMRYLKNKVKKFTLTEKELIVHRYTTSDLPDLFRYFNLRFNNNENTLKHIQIKTLYDCWDMNKNCSLSEFEKELNRYIVNVIGQDNAFIFQGELLLKPYKEKSNNIGVSIV